ncbi:MAG: response regulator transcription factor [Rhodothermales bacterium]
MRYNESTTIPGREQADTDSKDPRLLIAEDEWAMSRGLTYLFKRNGYEVVPVDNGREAVRQLVADPPFDVAILDVMMPHMDGFEVLEHVRGHAVQTPIIMLSVKGSEEDKVQGFDLGADDYVTKPFSERELVARVEAVRRRSPGAEEPPPEACRLGDIVINFATYTARRGEEDIALTRLEFDVLRHLVRRRGHAVSRDEFKREVWKMPEDVATRTMDRHIIALREKIEPDPKNPRYIITVFGVGYRLEEYELLA